MTILFHRDKVVQIICASIPTAQMLSDCFIQAHLSNHIVIGTSLILSLDDYQALDAGMIFKSDTHKKVYPNRVTT